MRKLKFDKNKLYFISIAGAHEGTKMANFLIKTPIKYLLGNTLKDLCY